MKCQPQYAPYEPATHLGEVDKNVNLDRWGKVKAAASAVAAAAAVVGLRVAWHDAHWSALCCEPITCDFASSSSNR
jgi:hypothetical protein